jgi:hypothetical protein
VTSEEMMKPPRPLFHLHDNGADSGPPSRTWSTEDIIFGGPPTPPSAAAHEDDEEYAYEGSLRGHDTNGTYARAGELPSIPRPLRSRRGRRLTAVVTEIADDRDFLRELNRELALATRYATAEYMSMATGSYADDGVSREEEDHHGGVEMLPGRVTMSEDGHGIGRRGTDGAKWAHAQTSASVHTQMHMSKSTSSAPVPLLASVRPPLPPPLPPGYDPHLEAERLDMARKAMMCVREIIRTERSYLAHLCSASEREVSSPCLQLALHSLFPPPFGFLFPSFSLNFMIERRDP